MHIVIMGCGRVGSTLALALEAKGHDVAVVDQEADAFRRLGSSFSGRRVTGVGFDQETLVEAGIEDAGAFAAVSTSIASARRKRSVGMPSVTRTRTRSPGRVCRTKITRPS